MQKSLTLRDYRLSALCVILLFSVALGQDDKARVAVENIESSTNDCSRSQAETLGTMLKYALENSNRFAVLDDPGSVDITVSGKVLEFEPEVKSGGMMGALKKKALGAAGADKKSASIEWELVLSDANTGKKIEKSKIEANSTDWSVDASDSYFSSEIGMVGELSTFSGKPMEDAIRELLAKSVEKIAAVTPKEYFAYSGEETPAPTEDAQPTAESAPPGTSSEGPVAEDMTLYAKYDFIPGDKVIFYDDLSGEEEGEFPFRWNFEKGVFEIARMGSDYWILCTDEGSIRPKVADAPLPEKYTVEMEFFMNKGNVSLGQFYIHWVDAKGKSIGYFRASGISGTSLTIQGKGLADKSLDERFSYGPHTMRIMATSRSIKCYLDQERVANVPTIEGFSPVGFRVAISPSGSTENPALFRNFRFAEGGKSLREQLDESGRIVTYGILFDSGSHKIKGESYRTLKDIGELLTNDPELRLSIEGHTDSDGADDYNMELSRKRAESVRSYLMSQYGITGVRLEAKGWGESTPIDVNTTPEGKTNNRRVELVKI